MTLPGEPALQTLPGPRLRPDRTGTNGRHPKMATLRIPFGDHLRFLRCEVHASNKNQSFRGLRYELCRRWSNFLFFTRPSHQNRLKQHSGRHRAQQCKRHHLPHA